MSKKFIALARVSSREQEREGFSLDVQEDALHKHAEREHGSIVKFFRIAETASKTDERKTFKELLAYAKAHADEIDGILFYKVDRAARNLFDYVELERLELETGVPAIFVSQPTENTPSGRMMRRTLANMAAFYTEQQALDVKDGLARRVKDGLFVGMAPYGYKNVRIDGRSIVQVHPEEGPRVRRLFELYAYHSHTIDTLIDALEKEGVVYSNAVTRFTRSKIHHILRDRAYIGEVTHKGEWYPGKQEKLIDRAMWDRVQVLLGDKVYRSHEMTYAGELIRCAHCGHIITGEVKTKKTKDGEREYVYYRCAKYSVKDHPRVRVTEANFDAQVLALFRKMKIADEKIKNWFSRALHARAKQSQAASQERLGELKRQHTAVTQQQDRLLNLRLVDEINEATFAAKSTELRDRADRLRLEIEAADRGRAEYTDLAIKAFELSQRLEEKWTCADFQAKRQILEIICLNFTLDGVTLCPEMRKPFDVLAEGLVLKRSRGVGN